MTEVEWLACSDSLRMLEIIRNPTLGVSDRKLRLFACACCRSVWNLLTEYQRERLDTVERYADGACQDLVHTNHEWMVGVYVDGVYRADPVASAAHICAREAAWWAARAGAAVRASTRPLQVGGQEKKARFYRVMTLGPQLQATRGEQAIQSDLVRCLFRYPFRADHTLSVSLTPLVPVMARAIYDGRAYEDLPILADALEDAGCNNADILSHLRDPRPHVRGCWAVDLILNKS